jgi:hypothetical protein
MRNYLERVPTWMILIMSILFAPGIVHASPDPCGCSRQVRLKPDTGSWNGGDFDNCDGRIVGPRTVCAGYQALYNVTASEVRNSCSKVTWKFPSISGPITQDDGIISGCGLNPQQYPFKAEITPDEGCPGKIKVVATAESSCTKDCGKASLDVEIVKPGELDSIEDKIDKLNRQFKRVYTGCIGG